MPSDPKHDPGWQWYARRYGSSTQTNPDPLPSARVVDVDRLVAEAVTEERKRILDALRILAGDGDCGAHQWCDDGCCGRCCHWYHMDPEARRPGPLRDLLAALVPLSQEPPNAE